MAKVGSVNIDEKAMQKALAAKAEGDNYTGAGDNLVNFGDASSFIDEDKTGKIFTLTIVSTDVNTVKLQLNKILSGTLASHKLIKEGAVDTNVTCAGSPNSTDLLVAYLEKYPSRLRSIKFSVDNPEQLDEPIKLITDDVFGSQTTKQLIPSSFQSQDTQNPKMVELTSDVIEKWMISDKSTLSYGIHAGRTVTLTLKFGAAVDLPKALEGKAEEAKMTVAQAYVRSKKA